MKERPPRKMLQRLLSFPFTPQEKDFLVDHLESTEKNNEIAKEILLIWNIQAAQFSAAREIVQGDGQANVKRRMIREGLEKAAPDL